MNPVTTRGPAFENCTFE